jgi:hypothetical protein
LQQAATFTGIRYDVTDHEKAATSCVEVWQSVLPHALKSKKIGSFAPQGIHELPVSCPQSGAFRRRAARPRKKPRYPHLQGIGAENDGDGNAVSGLPDETPIAKRRLA